MGNKSSRRWKPEGSWRRHQDRKSYRSTLAKFLRTQKQHLLTTILLLVLLTLLFVILGPLPAPNTNQPPNGVVAVSYNTLIDQVQAGNIHTVTIQNGHLTATLAHAFRLQACVALVGSSYNAFASFLPASPANATCTIDTRLPATGDSALLPLLHSHHVAITWLPTTQTPFILHLLRVGIPLVIVLLIFLGLSSMFPPHLNNDRFTQMAKHHARRFDPSAENNKSQPLPEQPAATQHTSIWQTGLKPTVTFADVAGIDEVRAELVELVQFLRSPSRFDRLGAHIPSGVLLVGPPGTGKTLLAKAVAGEAGVPFFSASASEFVEMFVGIGASRVRNLFQQARQAAPSVIFIDELDAVGRHRSMRITDHAERDQTLNQLLIELDGFNERSAVIVLAATNRLDMLDRALLRPGRFDRHIVVSLPDRAGREAILRIHTRRTPLHSDVDLTRLARQSTGMSGADLANLVNEAALCAARQDLDMLTAACFDEALERIQLGLRRPLVMSEEDRRVIAFHESGHALVAHYLPTADPVNRISILPHGQSLGITQFTQEEDRYNYSREVLMARIAVGLGGRVAEELVFSPSGITTGAENDLQSVTSLAWRMVTHWGMGKQVGVVFADYANGNGYAASSIRLPSPGFIASSLLQGAQQATRRLMSSMMPPGQRYVSSATMAAMIDSEIQCILEEGRATAHTILSQHYAQLTMLAQALIEHEQLNRAAFETLLQG